MILTKMKEIAEIYLIEKISAAVITVPAYFNNAQRRATVDAGRIAGLNVLKIINEPTAAAIAFGYDNMKIMANSKLLVFDLGGGTFDVTIMHAYEHKLTVLATSGNTHLGGEDFNHRLVEHCAQAFERIHKVDIRANYSVMRRLRVACETAKHELSSAIRTDILVPTLWNGIDFALSISRARFEQLNATLFHKTIETVQIALDDAHLTKYDIDRVLLVGGSTRIPKIMNLLQEFFDGKPIDHTVHPEEAVAYGAAIHAAILNGDISDKIFGSALSDVTPLSLGIGCGENFERMDVVVPRNTSLPCREIYHTSTYWHRQRIVRFPIYQGESAQAKDNSLLGDFVLTGFPIAQRGTPKFVVTFDIDTNGILLVSAKDLINNTSNGITIADVYDQTRMNELNRMIDKAEEYRNEIKIRHSTVCPRDALELLCYEIRDNLIPNTGNLSQREKAVILSKCDEILKLIEGNFLKSDALIKTYEKQLRTCTVKLFKRFKGSGYCQIDGVKMKKLKEK